MPAGKNNRQTARHDGSKSRICVYCGGVGARCRHNHQLAHRRCIPKQRPIPVDRALAEFDEGLHGPRITSKTSMGHCGSRAVTKWSVG